MKAKTALRETARATRENPSFMINNKKAELADSVQDHLGSDASLKRMLQRERRKDTPKDPKKLADLVIEEPYTKTIGDNDERQQFLIYDNGQDSDARILVFASPTGLRALDNSSVWFMDGTFSVAPTIFKQLYAIRVPLSNSSVGVAYALLQNKTQETYEEMMRAIVTAMEAIHLYPDPDVVHVDFEQANISAVRQVFGNELTIRGFLSPDASNLAKNPGTWTYKQVPRG